MSTVDISNLPSILKDQSRRKIILALQQRGPLTYTELLNILDTAHTGKLNYHLKVLGDLIAKDEDTSKYGLTQKGELASQLLTKGFGGNGYSGRGWNLFDIGRMLTIVGAAFLFLPILGLTASYEQEFEIALIGIPCTVCILAIGASVNASQSRTKLLAILGIPLSCGGFIAANGIVTNLTYDIGLLARTGSSFSADLGFILALTGLVLLLSYRNRTSSS